MLDRGLAAVHIERAGLKQNVSTRFFEPFADVAARVGWGDRPTAVQNGERIEAIGVRDPARPARGDPGEPPADVVTAAQLGFLRDEQAQKFAAYVAEANDRKIIGRNGPTLSESVRRGRGQFRGGGRDQRGFVLQDARDNDNGFVGLLPFL